MTCRSLGLLCLCLCWTVLFAQQQNDVNVALGKNYSQISKHLDSNKPSQGANNNTNYYYYPAINCIHTKADGAYNPWWQVDLGRTYPVRKIDIWARYNFKNRVDPASITVDNQTCASTLDFQWTDRTLSYEKEVTCSSVMYGRRVRITRQGNDEPLTMCEMQIWVPREVSDCQVGKHGPMCNSDCSDKCGKGRGKNFCYKSNGYCYDGCVDGWYRDQCSSPCSPGCQNTVCDRQSGQCSPCKAGYTGNKCTDCTDGYYKRPDNPGCNLCTWSCKSGTICDKNTGHCPICPPGKQGDFCDQDCNSGRYGQNCTEKCGQCRSQNLPGYCRPDTGRCAYGCLDGWLGFLCKKECDDGHYGPGCTGRCGQCKGAAVCNKTNGHCAVCDPGWNLPSCNTTCSDGSYGENCAKRCGSCQGVACNKTSGHCRCTEGKQPPLCAEDCQRQKYGQNCTETCGQCKGGQTCDPVTGRCTKGCQPGWTDLPPSSDNFCRSECPVGVYGDGCNQTCGNCQKRAECRHDTGECTGQCSEGFTGSHCVEESSSGSDKESVNTNAIIGSVFGGALIIGICVIVLGILLRRRFVRSEETRHNKTEFNERDINISSTSPRPEDPADREQRARDLQTAQDQEQPYEIPEDLAVASVNVYPKASEIKCSQFEADSTNPYDQLTVQYYNTGEVHLYNR